MVFIGKIERSFNSQIDKRSTNDIKNIFGDRRQIRASCVSARKNHDDFRIAQLFVREQRAKNNFIAFDNARRRYAQIAEGIVFIDICACIKKH